MPDLHSALMIAVIALVTAILRFLPFLIFGENRKTPPLVSYLGQVLPYGYAGGILSEGSFSDCLSLWYPGAYWLCCGNIAAHLEAQYTAEYRRRHRLLHADGTIYLLME